MARWSEHELLLPPSAPPPANWLVCSRQRAVPEGGAYRVGSWESVLDLPQGTEKAPRQAGLIAPGMTGLLSPSSGSDAHAVCARAHLAMIAGPTFDVERTRLPGGTVGIKRVVIRDSIVSIAGKLTAGTHANDTTAWFETLATGRTVGIERTCHGLEARKEQCQSCKAAFPDDHVNHSLDLSRAATLIQVFGSNHVANEVQVLPPPSCGTAAKSKRWLSAPDI